MIKNKTRQNFSIDKKVSEDFKKKCESKSINMSKLIEKFMIQFLSESQ